MDFRCHARIRRGRVVVQLLNVFGRGLVVRLREVGGNLVVRQARHIGGGLRRRFHLEAWEREEWGAGRRRSGRLWA